MECKDYCGYAIMDGNIVEIDTLWNVKVGDRTDQMGHGRVEIDTLWNVKFVAEMMEIAQLFR